MTDVQERLLTLTDEIDEICSETGLYYFLADGTAIAAYLKHGYTAEEYEMKLIMPFSDIRSFIKAARKKHRRDREIETPEDNYLMSVPCVRYVDKNSLLVDYSSTNYFRKNGVAVTIFPLFPKLPEDLEKRIVDMIKKNSRGKKYDPKAKPGKEVKHIIKDIYALNADRKDCIYYIDSKGKTIRVSDDDGSMADWSDRKKFFGHSYRVPGEKYFELRYGNKISEKHYSPLPGTDRIRVIADCDMPYRQFDRFTKNGRNPEDMKRSRRSYISWKKSRHDPMMRKTMHVLDQVKRSRDRIDVWISLKDKRDALKQAESDGNIKKLKKLMKTYLKDTDLYYKHEIGFYIDDELFSYAKEIWKADGRPDDYADSVYDLVPDIYKHETPDDYFAKRREEGRMI